MARTLRVNTSIHLRDEDWVLVGNYSPGTPARRFAYGGEGDPGDPPEVTDVEITADGHDGVIEYDHLTRDEQAQVDDTIACAAAEDGDDDDRRYDEYRDRRAGL